MVIAPSASRAQATHNFDFRLPARAVGLLVVVDLTTHTATSLADVKLQYWDEAALTPAFRDLMSADAAPLSVAVQQLTAVSTKTFAVDPRLPDGAGGAVANRSFSGVCPAKLRAVLVIGTAGPDTLSITGVPIF